jgi:hypothetical protein
MYVHTNQHFTKDYNSKENTASVADMSTGSRLLLASLSK